MKKLIPITEKYDIARRYRDGEPRNKLAKEYDIDPTCIDKYYSGLMVNKNYTFVRWKHLSDVEKRQLVQRWIDGKLSLNEIANGWCTGTETIKKYAIKQGMISADKTAERCKDGQARAVVRNKTVIVQETLSETLPKCHGRLIDADILKEKINEIMNSPYKRSDSAFIHITGVWAAIDATPTIAERTNNGE